MIVAGMGFRKGADLGHDAAGQAADKQRQRRRRAGIAAVKRAFVGGQLKGLDHRLHQHLIAFGNVAVAREHRVYSR